MLMRTDPFRELDRLTQQVFGHPRHPRPAVGDADGRLARRGQFLVEFDLPGVDPDSIDLDVERNVVTVKAERPALDGDAELIAAERPRGVFSRQLILGDNLDTEQHRRRLRRRRAHPADPGRRAGQAPQDRDQQRRTATGRRSTPDGPHGGTGHVARPDLSSTHAAYAEQICQDDLLRPSSRRSSPRRGRAPRPIGENGLPTGPGRAPGRGPDPGAEPTCQPSPTRTPNSACHRRHPAEMHRAFRRRLREHHPDTRPQQDDRADSASDQALQRVLAAYQTLRHQTVSPRVETPTDGEQHRPDRQALDSPVREPRRPAFRGNSRALGARCRYRVESLRRSGPNKSWRPVA